MSPLCPTDISPKYDMKSFHDYFNFGSRIWGRKSVEPQADTSKWEEEINQLVYQLYGLTEDEVKIVDGR